MGKPQRDDIKKALSGIEKLIRVFGIVMIVWFAVETLFFIFAYVAIALMKYGHLQDLSPWWYLVPFLYVFFDMVTPVLLILTASAAGYSLFRVVKQNGNSRALKIALIALGMNLLAIFSIYAFERAFTPENVDPTKCSKAAEQKKWKGKVLPDFTFQGIHEGMLPITINDLKGKTSVLIFWATYDTPWSSNFRYAQELLKKREELNINVFAIAADESEAEIRKYLNKFPTVIPVYHNPNANYKRKLGIVGSVEEVLIIDSMARIQNVLGSPDSLHEIEAALNEVQSKCNRNNTSENHGKESQPGIEEP